jgi:hypothetical protein
VRFAGDPRYPSLGLRRVAFALSTVTPRQRDRHELIALAVAQAVTGLSSDRQFLGMVGRAVETGHERQTALVLAERGPPSTAGLCDGASVHGLETATLVAPAQAPRSVCEACADRALAIRIKKQAKAGRDCVRRRGIH